MTDETYHSYWNSFLPIFLDLTSRTMRKQMNQIVEQYGITSAHASYLISLKLQGPMSQKELSLFLDMDPANTNRVLKVLSEKGMIYDDRKTPTSRNYKIYLTVIGSNIAENTMKKTNQWFDSITEDVPEEEILKTRNLLIKLLRKMDAGVDDYMKSQYTNPFYTYLSVNPPGEEQFIIRKTVDEE